MGKELLNEPDKVVHELLEGLVASVEHLNRLDGFPEVCPPHISSESIQAASHPPQA